MKVGFIGLGLMGTPMSTNILKKGFDMTVWNRSSDKTADVEKLGAKIAKSPYELGQTSDVIITMVTAGKDVEEILFGKKGVVEGADKRDLLIIDMSTIGPTKAREIAGKLADQGIDFLDAPVTGSTPKAITGELTIFIGGDENTFTSVKDLLGAMGTNLQYMGETGSGQAIKLINNLLAAVSVEALGEGMLLADAMGLDREKAAETLVTVPAVSDYMKLKIQNFVKNDFPLQFSTANMGKDVNLALTESKKSQASFPVLSDVVKLYDKALAEGMSDQDMSTLVKVIEKK